MTQALFRDNSYRTDTDATVLASEPRGIALDRTVFYPQGGGQSGDKGTLLLEDGTTVPIVNTIYDSDRATILHMPAEDAVRPRPARASSLASTGICDSTACAPTPRSICSRSFCPIR